MLQQIQLQGYQKQQPLNNIQLVFSQPSPLPSLPPPFPEVSQMPPPKQIPAELLADDALPECPEKLSDSLKETPKFKAGKSPKTSLNSIYLMTVKTIPKPTSPENNRKTYTRKTTKQKSKAQEAEPVVLTISSDEEGESNGSESRIPEITTTLVSNRKQDNFTDRRELVIYPPGKGGIAIYTQDYMCLKPGTFMNDTLIDFYIKYLITELIPKSFKEKVLFLSSFFYERLTTKTPNLYETDANLTIEEKRHLRVKNWTKNINIFEKDFIIMPVIQNNHWFLVIICFPGMEGWRPMNGGSESQDSETESESSFAEKIVKHHEPIMQPCILIFDSFARAARCNVVATLRDYLTCEHRTKLKSNKTYTKDNIKGHNLQVPQQTNCTDCGLYVLQYAEAFFMDPIKNFRIPITQLNNWFDEIVVTKKREDISNLIKQLMLKNKKDPNILPHIMFPRLYSQSLPRPASKRMPTCRATDSEINKKQKLN